MPVLPLASSTWKFRDATENLPWRDATVPGCVHRDLLRHELIPDPFYGTNELDLQWIEQHVWEYRTHFQVSKKLLAEDVLELICEGLDTLATVTLNGRKVATTDNMFVTHRFNVRRFLKSGRNELLIKFASTGKALARTRPEHQPKEFNDAVGRCSVFRKEQCQFGWDWGPRLVTSGIWRDIRLEAWSANRLESVRVTQTHHRKAKSKLVTSVTLKFTPELTRARKSVSYRVTLSRGDEVVADRDGRAEDLEITVVNPELWWPNGHGEQPLYTLTVVGRDSKGHELGTWSQRIGLRTIELDRSADKWGEWPPDICEGC